MSFKTIVAVLQSENDAARVLDAVIPLAKRFGSHVVGVHAEPMPLAYASPIGLPAADFIEAAGELNRQRAAALLAAFTERMESAGLSAEWRAGDSVSGESALADLVSVRAADLVVARQADGETGSAAALEALLYEGGRPVLFVPFAGPVTASIKRVLVAWNGSREAARATFDALPFIREAQTTEILVIDPEPDAPVPASDIAASLARHGARVTAETQTSDGISVADVIENRIAETQTDMLVMGAYSASWLKEWLFGGTTRTVLRSMPSLTFMSR